MEEEHWRINPATKSEDGQRHVFPVSASARKRRASSGCPIVVPSSIHIGACVLAPVLPRVTVAALLGGSSSSRVAPTAPLVGNKKKESNALKQLVTRRDGDGSCGEEDAAYRPAVVQQIDSLSGVAVVTFVEDMRWERQAADEHAVPLSSLGELPPAAAQRLRSIASLLATRSCRTEDDRSGLGCHRVMMPEEFRTAALPGANGYRSILISTQGTNTICDRSASATTPILLHQSIDTSTLVFLLLFRIMLIDCGETAADCEHHAARGEAAMTAGRRQDGTGGGGSTTTTTSRRRNRMLLFDDVRIMQQTSDILCLTVHAQRSDDAVFCLRPGQSSHSSCSVSDAAAAAAEAVASSVNAIHRSGKSVAGVDWLLGMWPALQIHVTSQADAMSLTFDPVYGSPAAKTIDSSRRGPLDQKIDAICWMVASGMNWTKMPAGAKRDSTANDDAEAVALELQLKFASKFTGAITPLDKAASSTTGDNHNSGSNEVRPKANASSAPVVSAPPRLVQYRLVRQAEMRTANRCGGVDSSPVASATLATPPVARRISLQDIAGGHPYHCNSSSKRSSTGRGASLPPMEEQPQLTFASPVHRRLANTSAIETMRHVSLPPSASVLRAARSLLSSPTSSTPRDDEKNSTNDESALGLGKRPRSPWRCNDTVVGRQSEERVGTSTCYETLRTNWMALAADALLGWSDSNLHAASQSSNVAALPGLIDALRTDLITMDRRHCRAPYALPNEVTIAAGGGRRILVVHTTSWEQCTSMSPTCVARRERDALRIDALANAVDGPCWVPSVPLRCCLAKSLISCVPSCSSSATSCSSVIHHPQWCVDAQAISKWVRCGGILILTVPERAPTTMDDQVGGSSWGGGVGGGRDAVESTICTSLDARALLALTNSDALVCLGRRGVEWAESHLSGAAPNISGVPSIAPYVTIGVYSELEVNFPLLELDREAARRVLERRVQWSIPVDDALPLSTNNCSLQTVKSEPDLDCDDHVRVNDDSLLGGSPLAAMPDGLPCSSTATNTPDLPHTVHLLQVLAQEHRRGSLTSMYPRTAHFASNGPSVPNSPIT